MKIFLRIIGYSWLFCSANVYAQWNNDPAINTPVCTTPGTNQWSPQVAPDGSGGFIIAWMEASADMSSAAIYAQHLSSTGTRLWAVSGISINGASGIYSDPQIVSDGNGGAIISWIFNNAGTLRHYVQRVSGSGQLLWNAGGVLVCPATVTPLPYYQLISDRNGGAIVLWDDVRSGNNQVYAQRISADGNLLWATNGLPCTANFTVLNSFEAVADSTGGLFITYTMTTNLLYYNEIFLQHVSANGVVEWDDAGENVSHAQGDQLHSTLTIDSLDNVIVAWQDFRLDPVISQIWGQRMNKHRELKWPVDGKMLVDSVGPDHALLKIVTDTSRGAILTWHDDYTVGQSDTAHVFGIRIDSTGSTIWEKTEVATWATTQFPQPYELVPDFRSGAYLSWVSPTSAGPQFAQHILPDGSLEFSIPGKVISSATQNQALQQLSCDSNGVAVATWMDLRSMSSYDVYAALVSAASTLPVNWVSFSGDVRGADVLLQWQTSDEVNNKGFTVQRSQNGVGFDSIGFVVPSSLYNYSFTDENALPGSNFYRLLQRDIDGKIAYSKTIRIDMNEILQVRIYPNPASTMIRVSGVVPGSLITIYGVDGRMHSMLKAKNATVEIDISQLNKGTYYLQVTGSDGRQLQSMLLVQ